MALIHVLLQALMRKQVSDQAASGRGSGCTKMNSDSMTQSQMTSVFDSIRKNSSTSIKAGDEF